jgi:hypothetical protein
MQAAINYLNDTASKQRVSLFPSAQGDQDAINAIKRGNIRSYGNRRQTPRPTFQTVWVSPYLATA